MTSLARLGRLFPPSSSIESVRTRVHFDATPEDVWRRMLFYEEVPRRPMPLLRLFLPAPIRTEGAKTRLGETIRCTYDRGYLEKRITAVEPARLIRFEVGVQALGIEDCISMTGGSYEIESDGEGAGCALVLTTRYHGHLRPRWMWRPLERYLAHLLHRHILFGMRGLLENEGRSAAGASVGRAGGSPGLVEQSVSHRSRKQRRDDGSAGDPVSP
jgi:hypothetical protein